MRPIYEKYLMVALILFLFASGCGTANIQANSPTVTFHNNQCIYGGAASVTAGKVSVTMVVEKNAKDAGMVVLAFDEGKTIDDLKALPPDADQPLWSHRIGEAARHIHPGETYTYEFTAGTDPFYLVCFYGPLPDLRIGEIGPIAVTK